MQSQSINQDKLKNRNESLVDILSRFFLNTCLIAVLAVMLEMQTDKTNTYDLNVAMQNIFTEQYFNSTFRDFTCKAILLSILLI